jgi:hypothetical protein
MSSLLRALWVLFLLSITGLGVWLASSLVAYAGGPAELACLGGVLLFPVLPLWWEKRATDAFHAQLRRSTRLLPKKRWLTAWTRIALRTVFLNLVFITALIALWPKVAFAALATRGDWFLSDSQGVWTQRGRAVLLAAASGLEWVHTAAHDNPNRTKEDEQQVVPDTVQPVVAVVTPFGSGARWRPKDPPPPPKPDEPPAPEVPPEKPPAPEDVPAWTVGSTSWPWTQTVHPVVAGMTAADETSPEAVARYIAARVTDPFERVKALHDWVVTRLRYDSASVTGVRKKQDAQSVFLSRLGVCEGYARLLVEFGKYSGDRFVYVTGEVREEHGQLAPVGHAWNAVEVKGAWYLLDATWDDPVMNDGSDAYRTDYLFIPPDLAALNHFPDEPRWQLRAQALSRAEFLRQPLATPGLAKEHLELKSPSRAVVQVNDTFELSLGNPAHVFVMVQMMPEQTKCGPSDAAELALSCPVARGSEEAVVFVNDTRDGVYDSVASFKVERR